MLSTLTSAASSTRRSAIAPRARCEQLLKINRNGYGYCTQRKKKTNHLLYCLFSLLSFLCSPPSVLDASWPGLLQSSCLLSPRGQPFYWPCRLVIVNMNPLIFILLLGLSSCFPLVSALFSLLTALCSFPSALVCFAGWITCSIHDHLPHS